MAIHTISQEELKRLLHYSPETGIFTWRINRGKCHIGDIAGTIDNTRYVRIGLNYTRFRAHRLAFIYMTGECPDETDHINRVRSDNRWCNLRPVTHLWNMRNMPKLSTNNSGVCGVNWMPKKNRWRAEIHVGTAIHLGLYKTKPEAIAARNAAEKIFKFHQNHGRDLPI